MKKEFYAHSREGKPLDHWHRLEDHLGSVAEMARKFAEEFNAGEWGYLAGLWHDLGKYQDEFQQKLIDSNDSDAAIHVNHSTSGALLVDRMHSLLGRIIAYPIAGHHAGLPDWVHEIGSGGSLSTRLQETELLDRIADRIPPGILDQPMPKPIPPGNKPMTDEHLHLWLRMIFSCLVDADFLDTECFSEPEKTKQRGSSVDLSQLKSLFDEYMANKQKEVKDSPVNHQRRAILSMCRKKGKLPPGIFSLTAPTGSGKTLSAMGFALEHASHCHKRRVIVAIPYTSIIEQTAAEYKKVFGEDNVLEHHSNLDPDRETIKNRLASENWDMPIVVTTNVQLFESLFASRTSACRKLHNLVNSIIILDEAQMLPPEYLKPILSGLLALVTHFGVTVVLCTATQPALSGRIGSPPAQFNGLSDVVEIIDNPAVTADALERVGIVTPSNTNKSTWEQIAGELRQYEQVLCIVNSRQDCRDLHALMPSGTIHLSGLMCAEERSGVISDIKEKLRDDIPIRVISTQLVEAGVDIDFPVVYRALAGFDSLAQAAGRCNREGKLNSSGRLGKVVLFEPPRPAPVGLLRKGQDAGREILRTRNPKNLSPDIFNDYFQLFYGRVNDFDRPRFHDRLVTDARMFQFQFRTFAENFHLIDDAEQKGIIVWFKNNHVDSQELIELLRSKGPERWLMRKLQRFIVNVHERLHGELQRKTLIEDIQGFSVQSSPGLYRPGLGLLADVSSWDPGMFIL
ncbi:MAG: CRISPR-associated helicase Cas3' [Thermodesulfobacteriota bacterium]